MAITYPLVTGFYQSFGAPTVSATKNVGTGSNRYAVALVGKNQSDDTPTGISIGTDVLTLQGSVVTMGTATKWGVWYAPLTVTGSQSVDATYTGAHTSGFAEVHLIVIQGDAALTIAHFAAPTNDASGGAGTTTRTITTTSGDTAVKLGIEISFAQSPSGYGTGTTAITNDAGPPGFFTTKRTAATTSTAVAETWASGFDVIETGFSVTEAGGGGGAGITFAGPNISNIAGSNGVAITPVDVSGKTTGSTGSIAHTKSPGGTTWPSWAALNSGTGVISGTPDAVATTTGCKVRYTDSIGNVDSNTFNFVVSAVTRTVTVTLTSDGTTPRASLTGLKWAWWDVVTPDLMTAAPTDKAATGTTNSSGVFTVSLPGSALSAGATGWLTVTNSTGSASQSPSALAFSGPVVVS